MHQTPHVVMNVGHPEGVIPSGDSAALIQAEHMGQLPRCLIQGITHICRGSNDSIYSESSSMHVVKGKASVCLERLCKMHNDALYWLPGACFSVQALRPFSHDHDDAGRAVLTYLIMGGIGTLYDELLPIFCSEDLEHGGLGMSSGQIGQILMVCGCALMVFQMFGYSRLSKALGPLRLLRVACWGHVLMMLLPAFGTTVRL